ncbi:mucin-2-like isoform X2 [Haliotis rufescens]|uniref:mucin-2-like isoform X2 n=1 Tax=Haliotis rufescens TaxID=6454 RepID=UPI00201F0F74|nr:mucin-2-like isoform X2 [Haliotis rufescens]
MMVKHNQVHVLLVLTVTFIHGVSPTQVPCPGGVATLETEYTIAGDRSSYTGFIWVRPTDGRYVVTCNPRCSPVAGYSATNDTLSTLTIDSVGVNDTGTWKIVDANVVDAIPVDVCHLTAAKTPECNISTDVDTDALELGTNLTVTVYINGYYCSKETGFNLTTGAVMETLSTKHNVSDVKTDVINKTINIDLSRFGDVTVSFACDVMSSDLSCSGVKRLLKSPPQCNISSDTDTDVLEPGTNLTLTVDMRGYYCSQQAGFDLTTGSVTDVLLQNQTTHNITDTVQHHVFNVSSDRLGNVSVMFRCDNTNRSLTCDGVSKLSAAPSPTTAPPSTAAPSPTTAPTSTAAPSPTTSPTSTGTSYTSPSSPTASERSSTPTSPSTTESSPSDLTLGLAIGLTLLFCVIVLGIVLCFRERLKKIGRYIVQSPDKILKQRHEMRSQQPIQDNFSSIG